MELINTILGQPLGWIMYACYRLVHNYAATLLLFTIISKIILLPISLMVQKNSIKMVKLQPEIDELKKLYGNDKEQLSEAQYKLFEREGYNPAIGCLPTVIQIPIVLGLIQVIYHPLQHLFRIPRQICDEIIAKTSELLGRELVGNSAELNVIEAIRGSEFGESIRSFGLIAEETFEKIRAMDLNFCGLNLAETPSISHPGWLWIVPICSGLSALALCMYQDRENVLQREQGKLQQWGMSAFVVLFSLYFTFLVPAGIGFYWILSNLIAIVQLAVLNRIYDPSKYIDYEARAKAAAAEAAETAESPEEAAERKEREMALQRRERDDENRFFDAKNKLLVVYAEGSGFYNYFDTTLRYIMDHSKIIIHYVTNDPNDAVFQKNLPNLVPYYISDKRIGNLFASMDADMVLMSTPNLQTYHVKRSIVRKDIEYVFLFHGISSTMSSDRKGAFDHFDTIFCVGPHHFREIRETEEMYKLKQKKLLEVGYGQLDKLLEDYGKMEKTENDMPMVLIAPSHQPGCIMESLIHEILESFNGKDYRVVVRPHPQFVKRNPGYMEKLEEQYADRIGPRLQFEYGFTSHASIYSADLLITDWSGTAFEFSFVTKRPSLFINTPMKILNPDYPKYKSPAIEIEFRNIGGVAIEESDVPRISDYASDLLARKNEYSKAITDFMNEYIYNIGKSGEVGGKYIIRSLIEKNRNKKKD